MSKFICPVCRNDHSCKSVENNSLILCFRGNHKDYETGDLSYRFIKPLASNMGGLWAKVGKASEYSYDPFKALPEPKPSDWVTLSDDVIDKAYRTVLADLELSYFDKNSLKKRGIENSDFLRKQGFRSWVTRKPVNVKVNVPGIIKGLVTGYNGLFIPTLTPWGKLIGCQIAPRRTDLPKYLFLKGVNEVRENKGFIIGCAHAYPEFAKTRSIPTAKLIVSTSSTTLETVVTGAIVDTLGGTIARAAKTFKPFQNETLAELNALLLGLQLVLVTGVQNLDICGVSPKTRQIIKSNEIEDARVSTLTRFVNELLDAQFSYSFIHEAIVKAFEPTQDDFNRGDKFLDTKEVWFVDSPAKAWYAAQKHHKVILGCPAANHASNLADLKNYLEALKPEVCIHAPDAGDVINKSTIPAISYNLQKTLKGLQYKTLVAWWGQVEKSDGDIDDIDTLENVEFITTEAFLNLHSPEIQSTMEPKKFHRQGIHAVTENYHYPRDIQYKQPNYFLEGSRKDILNLFFKQGLKFIHDNSYAGSGKSRDFSTFNPKDFDVNKIWWGVSDAVTTEYVGWHQYRGRDFGRILQSDGRIVSAPPNTHTEELILQANCINAPFAGFLASHNVIPDGEKICKDCSFSAECKSNPSFYLKGRDIASKAARVRFHPSALDVALIKTPDGRKWTEDTELEPDLMLILDDVKSWVKSIQISTKDIKNFIEAHDDKLSYMPNLRNFLICLRHVLLIKGKNSRIDYQHNELIAKLPKLENLNQELVDQLIQAEFELLESSYNDSDSEPQKAWIGDLIEAFTNNGHINTYKGALSIYLKNDRLLKLINHPAVKHVIFADATAKTEHLAKWIGTEKIETIAQQQPETMGELKITQIVGLGDVGYQRSDRMIQKLDRLKKFMSEKHPDYAAIDIKSGVTDEAYGTKTLTWLASSRGSNTIKDYPGLTCYGTPRINLNAVYAEYALMTGIHPSEEATLTAYPVRYNNRKGRWVRVLKESIDEGFAEYCHQLINAEIIQGFNRLRHARRANEVLDIVFVSEYPLEAATEALTLDEYLEGYTAPTLKLRSKEVNVTAYAIIQAAKKLQELRFRVTKRALALIADVSESSVKTFFDKPGRDWKEFKTKAENAETLDSIQLWGLESCETYVDSDSLTLVNSNMPSPNPKTIQPQGLQPFSANFNANLDDSLGVSLEVKGAENPKTVFKFRIQP